MKTPRSRNQEFSKLGDVIQAVLAEYRRTADSRTAEIWRVWDEAVGPVIAASTRPAAYKNHLLIVHVSSSSWLQQLHFLKSDIIGQVNQALGDNLITDIRFQIGPR